MKKNYNTNISIFDFLREEDHCDFDEQSISFLEKTSTIMVNRDFVSLKKAFENIHDYHVANNGVKNYNLQKLYTKLSKAYYDALSAHNDKQLSYNNLEQKAWYEFYIYKGSALQIHNEDSQSDFESTQDTHTHNAHNQIENHSNHSIIAIEDEYADEAIDPTEYLVPEKKIGMDLEIYRFLESGVGAWPQPAGLYTAARSAMEAYREGVNGRANVHTLTNEESFTITANNAGQYSLAPTLGAWGPYHCTRPMDVWNKIAFYGSYRRIGQWLSNDDLVDGGKLIEVTATMRDAGNNASQLANSRKLWVATENSYIATVKYSGGKTYTEITEGPNNNHQADYLKCTSIYGFSIYDDRMINDVVGAGIGNHIQGANIVTEVTNLRAGYIGDPMHAATGAPAQIEDRLTVDAFINCYKLIVGTNINAGVGGAIGMGGTVTTSCNIRAFELFGPVVIAEVHRNSYTAVVNAAMMDLFKTPRDGPVDGPAAGRTKYGGDFSDFFGAMGNNLPYKHNMAFGSATGMLNLNGDDANWYQSIPGHNVATRRVINREKEVTKDWLKLLHNYECWTLSHGDMNGVNGGANYNDGDDVHRSTVNFGDNCIDQANFGHVLHWPVGDWDHLRNSFKIHAAYQAAKHLNGWNHHDNANNAVRDAAIAVAIDNHNIVNDVHAAGGNVAMQALYAGIVGCIHTAVQAGGGCHGGVFAGAGNINTDDNVTHQQEICIDVLCGLLNNNLLDYN